MFPSTSCFQSNNRPRASAENPLVSGTCDFRALISSAAPSYPCCFACTSRIYVVAVINQSVVSRFGSVIQLSVASLAQYSIKSNQTARDRSINQYARTRTHAPFSTTLAAPANRVRECTPPRQPRLGPSCRDRSMRKSVHESSERRVAPTTLGAPPFSSLPSPGRTCLSACVRPVGRFVVFTRCVERRARCNAEPWKQLETVGSERRNRLQRKHSRREMHETTLRAR